MNIALWTALAMAGIAVMSPEPDKSHLDSIKGYQTWNKLTTKPQIMPAQQSMLCSDVAATWSLGVHYRHNYLVYINNSNAKAVLAMGNKKFPEGTVIVKEKFRVIPAKTGGQKKPSKKLEFLTVMLKQKGAWEYFAFNEKGEESRASPTRCSRCHQRAEKTDFVFRDYLVLAKKAVK